MASTTSSLAFCLVSVLLVASCLLQIHHAATSDHCKLTGHGCEVALSLDMQSRKMLGASLEKTRKDGEAGVSDVKKSGGMMNGGDEKKKLVEWELRKAPSGPDPLHHNGNTPQKPRTDP